MCHLVNFLKPIRSSELDFYDRVQYWHRLQEEVVTTKKSWTGIASKVPGLALVLSICTRYLIPVVSKYFTV